MNLNTGTRSRSHPTYLGTGPRKMSTLNQLRLLNTAYRYAYLGTFSYAKFKRKVEISLSHLLWIHLVFVDNFDGLNGVRNFGPEFIHNNI
jgi:hypothetical protein